MVLHCVKEYNRYGKEKRSMEDTAFIKPSEYINLSFWSEFQNTLSTLLNVSIAIYDKDGSVISPPSGANEICEIIKKQTTKGLELYRDSYKRAIEKKPNAKVSSICTPPTNNEVEPISFITLGFICNPTIKRRKAIPK